MKGISLLARTCAAALLFSGVAWSAQPGAVIDSERFEDAKITNQQGEQLGGIERFLIDPQTGKIQFAVVGIGGFLGLGETEVAVPWEVLQVTRAESGNLEVRLNATREKLEKAPRLTEAEGARPFTPEGMQKLQTYWSTPDQQQPPAPEQSTPPQQQPSQQQQQDLGTPKNL